jgi:DNA-binding transcriptional LysR family regulator
LQITEYLITKVRLSALDWCVCGDDFVGWYTEYEITGLEPVSADISIFGHCRLLAHIPIIERHDLTIRKESLLIMRILRSIEGQTLPASTMVNTAGPGFDIVLLRTYLEVIDSRSFAIAAERLALTASAVSGHIKRLEQSAGTLLIARTTRRLHPTEAGKTLYMYAQEIVALEREAYASMHGRPARGRLRVGASEDFAGSWLPRVLTTFLRWHPELSLELKVGISADLLRQLARGRLDVVFGKQCSLTDDDGDLLWSEPLVWACAASMRIDPGAPVPLAVFPEPCAYREAALGALATAGRKSKIVFESASIAGCLSAALAGFAVAPVALSQMRQGLAEGTEACGLPPLPEVRLYGFTRHDFAAGPALVRAVRDAGRSARFAAP